MKNFNRVDIAGRIFSHKLEDKDGALRGTLDIEVSAEGQIATVNVYMKPVYNNGKTNNSYTMLDDIYTGRLKTVVDAGDNADWISCSCNIRVGYFKPREGDEAARSQRINCSFLNDNSRHQYKNEWKLDLMITKVIEREADAEKNLAAAMLINGYFADDYRESLLEFKCQTTNPKAMAVIAGLSCSDTIPYFVAVKGNIDEVKTTKVIEGAFGEDETIEFKSTAWELTWMAKNPYDFGDESAITMEEFQNYKKTLDETKEEAMKDKEGDGLVF